jgi:predicted nucleic acid-binding protein
LNRPFDDQSQERVRAETEAVMEIFRRVRVGNLEWVAGTVLLTELAQRDDSELAESLTLLVRASARHIVVVGLNETRRSAHLESLGIKTFDALHLASAESGGADVFFTTDDRLIRATARAASQIAVPVMTPVEWLEKESTWKRKH